LRPPAAHPHGRRRQSLNVSTAGAVVLYEAFRQRRAAANRVEGPVGASKKKKQKGLGS
jgi:23S rRNA (guanosine2251-2'-O)-methyltransferase